jgi:hypothetical protein
MIMHSVTILSFYAENSCFFGWHKITFDKLKSGLSTGGYGANQFGVDGR